MSASFTRRDFLTYSGGLGASVAVASLLARSARGASQARLTVSVRDAMLTHTGEQNAWAALKRIGSEGVEAAVSDDLALPSLSHAGEKYSLATDAGIAGESRRRRGRSEDHRLVHVQSLRGTPGQRGGIVYPGSPRGSGTWRHGDPY